MKILIVDDDAQNIQLLKAMLEGDGYEVVSAENGKKALARLKEGPFAMIVSDILMPVMDGFQFCRECKSDTELRKVPFVFYTATYTDSKDEAFALSLGAERFIPKPADPADFLAVIGEIMKSRREGKLVASPKQAENETVYFRQYNQALIRKLEDKLVEVQDLNRRMHESRVFLENVLRTTPSAVFSVDADRNITSWNPMAEKITGYTAEEVLGRKCDAVESPTCGDECRLFDERFPKPGEYRECLLVHKDGRILTTLKNFNLLNNSSGEILGGVESFIDVTDRMRMEAERNRLFTLSLDMLCIAGFDGYFKQLNPAWEKTLGWSQEELLSKPFLDFVHPEDRESTVEAANGLSEGKTVLAFENRYLCKNGSYRWFSWNSYPLVEEKLIFAVTRDVTAQKESEEALARSYENLRTTLNRTVQAIAMVVEARDPYTAGHQRRASDIARAVASEMGFSPDRIQGLQTAGMIHDIGKISVPAEILSKPSKLTALEFGLIKVHPRAGYDILKEIEFPWPVAQIILQHHERIDGSGYPAGLKGEEILMEARILAVADVVEAMATHRPYRPSQGIEAALEEISGGKEVHYDPAAVEACLQLFRKKGYRMLD